jgi:hypothetical protein
MKPNVGSTDRIVRAILGIALLLVALLAVEGRLAIVLGIAGVVLLGTAAASRCPAYAPFRIDTR